DRHHVPGTLFKPAHLAWRLADRPAHLPGDLLCDLLLAGDERLDEARDECCALREWHLLPLCVCRAATLQDAVEVSIGRQRSFDVDPPVDRGDGFLCFSHGSYDRQKSLPRRAQRYAKERKGNRRKISRLLAPSLCPARFKVRAIPRPMIRDGT